jgi:hypothetical protein
LPLFVAPKGQEKGNVPEEGLHTDGADRVLAKDRHARYYWLLLAESHLTRRLFGSMLQRIWALPVPTG